MTLAADTPRSEPAQVVGGMLRELAGLLRRRRSSRTAETSPGDALVRAMCHDMRSPLASLEALLRHLDGPADDDGERHAEVLELARAQTEHLSSMLRTAVATGGAVEGRAARRRRLADVVATAAAASGLPAGQLDAELVSDVGEVPVADARVQRILTNLLENAHRHGRGARVRLRVSRRPGWVDVFLSQSGVPADRVVGHLSTATPPQDLTGLGLWSVRRQTAELGGQLAWRREWDGEFTFVVRLPDR